MTTDVNEFITDLEAGIFADPVQYVRKTYASSVFKGNEENQTAETR